MLTKTQEEYLKTIYILQNEEKKARVTDIAKILNKTKPTVNYAITNLKEAGLVNYKTYGDISLTDMGKKYGKKILEAYDIVYLFLNGILELEPDKAESEAEKIKMAINDETLNKLAKYTHKTLGLYSLECGYDINNEKCRSCVRRTRNKKIEFEGKGDRPHFPHCRGRTLGRPGIKQQRKDRIMNNNLLEVKDLYVNAEGKEILKGMNLKVNKGEIHVIMGPNGSGKSTTANAILNNPSYKKTNGTITFEGEDITNSKTDEIARKGIFMSFQLPEEIPGVSVTNFLKYAKNKVTGKPVKIFEFKNELKKYMEELSMNPSYMERSLNVGFSGGEKKKNEILQLLVLNPKLAILDETDSGLDVDAIKTVSKGIEMFKNKKNAVLIITHNTKILSNLKPDYVHVLVDGKIVKTGTYELAKEIEENGYSKYKN